MRKLPLIVALMLISEVAWMSEIMIEPRPLRDVLEHAHLVVVAKRTGERRDVKLKQEGLEPGSVLEVEARLISFSVLEILKNDLDSTQLAPGLLPERKKNGEILVVDSGEVNMATEGVLYSRGISRSMVLQALKSSLGDGAIQSTERVVLMLVPQMKLESEWIYSTAVANAVESEKKLTEIRRLIEVSKRSREKEK